MTIIVSLQKKPLKIARMLDLSEKNKDILANM
jgi:hypothetical protein